MKKKKIVENDKKKIEELIQELDAKKNEALKKAWEQVNKVASLFKPIGFNPIFISTLMYKYLKAQIRKCLFVWHDSHIYTPVDRSFSRNCRTIQFL